MRELWSELIEGSVSRLQKSIEKLRMNDIPYLRAERMCLSRACVLFPKLFHVAAPGNELALKNMCEMGLDLLSSAKEIDDRVVYSGQVPSSEWASVMHGLLKFWYVYAGGGDADLRGLRDRLDSNLMCQAIDKKSLSWLAGMVYAIDGYFSVEISSFAKSLRGRLKEDRARLFFELGDCFLAGNSSSDTIVRWVRGAPMNTGDGTINLEDRAFAALLYLSKRNGSVDFFQVMDFVREPFFVLPPNVPC